MFEYLENFAKRPFDPAMNMGGWVLFVLFLIIIAGLWASVLNLIIDKGD